MIDSAVSPSVQIKVTLPLQLQQLSQAKASQFGLSLAAYIRHLVMADVKDMNLPTFKMSRKTERVALKALKDYSQGKTHQIVNIDDFTNAL